MFSSVQKASTVWRIGLGVGLFLAPGPAWANHPVTSPVASSAEVKIQQAIACHNGDQQEYACVNLMAVVDADSFITGLDDPLEPTNVILSLRYKKDAPLTRRWILFEAGGHGNGYGPLFGRVTPGQYAAGGRGYGDDLIRWYNESGYVTVDVIWECRDRSFGDPCYNSSLAGWVPAYPNATGWFRNSGGAGYVGTGSRTRAVIEWAVQNNGGRRVGAHGHSSGSGRLITALTRYQAENLFDTVVFDGGPVFAYIPWYCGIEDDGDPNNGVATPGPLGPKPLTFDIEAYGDGFRDNYDNARDPNNGDGASPYRNCTNHVWDAAPMLEDSHFYQASDRDFPSVDLAVVLGGRDVTPAAAHARLWFHGYAYGIESITGLKARTVTLQQGYCPDPHHPTATYLANENEHLCSDWEPENFPSAASVRYVADLSTVGHQTASSYGGARTMFNTMLTTLELVE
jgi:hypothetical protein